MDQLDILKEMEKADTLEVEARNKPSSKLDMLEKELMMQKNSSTTTVAVPVPSVWEKAQICFNGAFVLTLVAFLVVYARKKTLERKDSKSVQAKLDELIRAQASEQFRMMRDLDQSLRMSYRSHVRSEPMTDEEVAMRREQRTPERLNCV